VNCVRVPWKISRSAASSRTYVAALLVGGCRRVLQDLQDSSPGTWCTGMRMRGCVAPVVSGGVRSVGGVPGQGLWENVVGQAETLMG
jgi:hypothetical protein